MANMGWWTLFTKPLQALWSLKLCLGTMRITASRARGQHFFGVQKCVIAVIIISCSCIAIYVLFDSLWSCMCALELLLQQMSP